MEEIELVISKYDSIDIDKELSKFDTLIKFSTVFYADVAEIYDSMTRIKNLQRNPTGFNFNDAAILGLLVRIWKLMKEMVCYYGKSNGHMVSILARLVVESTVISKYLLIKGDAVIEDYRKCSYKDRLTILEDSKSTPDFFKSPPGIRLIQSIQKKMAAEKLTVQSFEEQKNKKWRLSGKTFRGIFEEIEPPGFYEYLYGLPSESIHGSWNESMDFHLSTNVDETFSTFPFDPEPDIRMLTPLLKITNKAYFLWLERIDVETEYFLKIFRRINAINVKLFDAFEIAYKIKKDETDEK